MATKILQSELERAELILLKKKNPLRPRMQINTVKLGSARTQRSLLLTDGPVSIGPRALALAAHTQTVKSSGQPYQTLILAERKPFRRRLASPMAFQIAFGHLPRQSRAASGSMFCLGETPGALPFDIRRR